MHLRRFTAVQFRRKMERGLNRPFLVMGAPLGGGERCPLVVKSRAGYADRPEAMLKELFALLLARELGLNAPEPWLERGHGAFGRCLEAMEQGNRAALHSCGNAGDRVCFRRDGGEP